MKIISNQNHYTKEETQAIKKGKISVEIPANSLVILKIK
jgi:alpha-N-arabinofuranosidase